ncbi:protein Atossa [Drosophila kikkawai]|uniref:Uncharacterized protein LOC108073086 isoform X1 n=1 Tax=Drosophila kikkawai TaxID=30033 RepID=A0A6P4HV52_DROKI|nr:uncharacterized protein LOC108073086 isoform X1 [Drosophila kikkawai]XP_017020043.1 uncharacterized protein LOC108073086 isoform X1 [Drosophila kikkawai]XP_017020044.1 uncharacterized protein LOC108073086 isoform X1 [Drosophila kikkawai]
MIPTSVTNSPPQAGLGQNGAAASLGSATAAAGNGAGGGTGGGSMGVGIGLGSSSAPGAQNNYSSFVLGLASLILEGRPIADDEYMVQQHHQQPGSGGATTGGGGRLSPRPSTSRAAINITTNPYGSMGGSDNRGGNGGGGGGASTSSSGSSLTHQRWTQKLCQLRQISPAAQAMSAEPELVSLAINDLNKDHGGDYEIVRRVMLNRAGGGLGGAGGVGVGGNSNNSSAASSPGSNSSDNILHSLQSLATTCLRGGPALAAPPPAEPRPLNLSFIWTGSVASSGGAGGGVGGGAAAALAAGGGGGGGASTIATASSGASSSASRPKHGPHCDQFLRKMGLAKGEMPSEAEEHICDMSYVNMTCNRWRAYCMKMEAILARREPVCIEVYLGPVTHKLLLEQWIISGKEKVPPPTMTLPSLCSAIRSQLYFSQIVAWCDLLRKCDPSVYDSGRVIFASCGNNAGDLATTCTPSGGQRRPRLNIFYRIKQHNANAGNGGGGQYQDGFSAKANVHNFPNVNVSESYSISVCVRSLPRINGGLPHVEPLPSPSPAPRSLRTCGGDPASTPTGGGGLHAATPTGLGARISAISSPTTTTMTGSSNCDNNGLKQGLDDLDGETSLSHRERQLQKYRKRMQRRDKKRERKNSPERQQPHHQPIEEPMEEGEESPSPSQSESQSLALSLQQPPRRIAMISTGTQTSLSSCQHCGSEKTLLCLSCTGGAKPEEDDSDADTTASEMEETNSSCSLSSGDLIVGTPRNKAELLLQAIQRTPKNRQRKPHAGQPVEATPSDLSGGQNNNLLKAATISGCQVCKRQKTQHIFANGREPKSNQTNGDQGNGFVSMLQEEEQENAAEQPTEEQIKTTKLTPNIERCSLNSLERGCKTPPPPVDDHMVVQFKTPLSQVPAKPQPDAMVPLQQQQQQKSSPKPSQLRLNCGSGLGDMETPPPPTNSSISPLMRKGAGVGVLPKVNLSTIFCSSAPIAIGCPAFSFDPAALSHAHSQLLAPEATGNTPPVQKSFSAPTLPHAASLSVSPRFAKQALAAHKRRSRHLSDRSDRSSLGSDEQLSDEDLESGLCSPAAGGSPLKCRARLAAHFAGRPLLGNLEESLLQRRLMPKIEVMGFKLQLGASGGFCPTQLTIPAMSYFYELQGETLSTPYLCEIRLPRKGYSVPRTGTVQATLLNPMGTVVRMFVIPYDMRDMPALHRTFIRQRILAEELGKDEEEDKTGKPAQQVPRSPTASSTTSKLGHFITAEQMKRLRYSIHLRFQTSRSGRLSLHTDIRLLISRRTDCDTAAAHAKGVLEAPNELVTDTLMPAEPRYSARQESTGSRI